MRRATQDAEATMSDAAAFESPPVVPALAAGVPAEGVKGVAVVTDPSAAGTRVGDRDVEGGVRAAEAAGHRRALGGEAHGRIHVPELGNVEVRAAGDAAKVDVHVQAEEDHATHVIRAHAPELTAHVQREVPEARIHLDRPSLEGSLAGDPGASRSAAQHDGGGRRDGHADRESIARRPAGTPAEEASAHRRTSRVRIVL